MNLTKSQSKLIANVVFATSFVILFFVFGLNRTLFGPPQSVHIWRQTNSLSLTNNYYQYDLPLFQPEMHNQFCEGGYSGKAVGEFPIIYYTVAQFWKVLGPHEWIFRLFQTLILFAGLWCLFQVMYYLLGNWFWSAFGSLLLFTSPMVVFYGPNFLPDGPGLAFVFIAWYFITKFLQNRKMASLWLSALFFALSMLLKITSGISFIALGGWVIYELIFQKKEDRIFNFQIKHFIPFVPVIIVVISWYLYVEHYNRIHLGHFSYHGIWPVWTMTKEQFFRIIDALDKIYFKQLFLPYTQYLTVGIWIYLLIIIKRLKPIFRYFIIVLPAGFIVQMLLWFQVLEGHDYYTINLLIVFAAIWAIFFYSLKNTRIIGHPVFYLSGAAFLVWNVVTCQNKIEIRYSSWMNDMYKNQFHALSDIEPLFKEIGIGPEDKVISLPDFTINGSLYFMDRKGYTEFASDFTKTETFYTRIDQGAKFLIVNDTTILRRDVIQPFIIKKIGEFKNIWVYDLQGIKPPE